VIKTVILIDKIKECSGNFPSTTRYSIACAPSIIRMHIIMIKNDQYFHIIKHKPRARGQN